MKPILLGIAALLLFVGGFFLGEKQGKLTVVHFIESAEVMGKKAVVVNDDVYIVDKTITVRQVKHD